MLWRYFKVHRVIEEITESNNWRDGEFAKFKINSQEVDSELWYRMCIPMIYAHWEGYIVSSLKILISHLNTLNLTPNDIPTKLIVTSLGDTYRSLSGKQSLEQKVVFTDKFKNTFDNKIKFSKRIDTKSNLRGEVLKDLCCIFDFDFNKFKDSISIIDRLVNIRNSIAHGENSYVVNGENVQLFIIEITNAMDIFLNEINDFITNERFLLQNKK